MQISFHGAVGHVTGSCSLVDSKGLKILIDCGLFQGGSKEEKKNYQPFGFDPGEVSAVIITHAHLDHVGRLPLLVKRGFNGPIFATPATIKLAGLILRDAVSIMGYEFKKFNEPMLYDLDDVNAVESQFSIVDYGEKKEISGQKSTKSKANFIFHEAGHIFGSAFVELRANNKTVVFSGDLGNTDVPILKETANMPIGVDAVICESTYGGRIHEAHTNEEREQIIEKTIISAIKRNGVLMIPSFALERTQQLLYILNKLIDRKHVIPALPIFLDSPLAINATEIYRQYPQYYDSAAKKLYSADDDLFSFSSLNVTKSVDESKKINNVAGPKIIIAGAGMMNGGRILHHAIRYMPDKNSTLLFIGYQANGTVGRRILEGEKQIKIMGQKIPIRCFVEAIGALSAHGDQNKILDWIGGAKTLPKQVIFNHGEIDQSKIVADRLRQDLGLKVNIAEEKKKYLI
ncbi:MAG: MBL fold metallo-hydrolase [bacterium]